MKLNNRPELDIPGNRVADRSMMIFAGNANPQLAHDITARLSLPLGKALVGQFSDGEVMVEIMENVRGKDIFIVQPTCRPSNDNLMELFGGAYHRGDSLFRLCATGSPAAFGTCTDYCQGGGRHDQRRRNRPGTDRGPAR